MILQWKGLLPGTDVVIFCGGRGTRLSEKTREMPKPLIELGEYPILWHIMKIYGHQDLTRFVLALGYKGEMIADYFLNRHPLSGDFTVRLSSPKPPKAPEDWEITFAQTGTGSKTAKRLLLCPGPYQDPALHGHLRGRDRRYRSPGPCRTARATEEETRRRRHHHDHPPLLEVRDREDGRGSRRDLPGEAPHGRVHQRRVHGRGGRGSSPTSVPARMSCSRRPSRRRPKTGNSAIMSTRGSGMPWTRTKDYEDLNRMWKEDPAWKIWSD